MKAIDTITQRIYELDEGPVSGKITFEKEKVPPELQKLKERYMQEIKAQKKMMEQKGKHHDLKEEPEYFEKVCAGIKNFELRKNDRDYRVGDTVTFREWTRQQGYSGRTSRTITINYVLKDVPQYGLQIDHCIFGWIN